MQKHDGRGGGATLSDAKRALLEKRLRGQAAGAARGRGAITRRAGDGPPRLSFAQERLWVLDQLDPGNPVYNIAAVSYLEGPLDVELLERTIREILRRHEALRTVFPVVDGEPVQVFLDPASFSVELEEVPEMPEAERDAHVRRRTREEGARRFDLASGPLFRVRLYRLSPVRHVFHTVKHHIVTDGWSMGALSHELEVIYKAFAAGEPSPLPELQIQYADYAAWQREHLTGETLRRQVEYWKEHLAGVPNLELPTDRPRPPVESHRGAFHRFLVPPEVTAGLAALSRREGVTLNMTITAAWAVLLARYAGQEDFAVGTLIGNRNRAETEGLIGFFVNTAALRMDLRGDPSYRDFLRRVRGALLDADAHQDLPFERVVEELKPPRDLGRHPLFQTMFFLHAFVVQHAPMPSPDLGGVTFASFDPESGIALQDTGAAKFDLGLGMVELGSVLSAILEYATDLFDAATAARIVDHLQALLAGIAADPDACVWDLPLAPDEELRTLESWGAARPDLPAEGTVLGRFEAQAARTPDAAALRSGSGSLTYAGLDARAERLAAELRLRGVAPGDRVGVALERSPELVAAMLGTWKAGAVYLPLDPAYPRERLDFLLADAAPKVVVRGDGTSLDGSGVELVVAGQAPSPPGPLSPASGRKGENGTEEKAPLPLAGEGLGRGPAPSPADLAYLIYTSGSTGTPKAVAVTHASLAATLAATADVLGFGAGDVVAALASPAFDISLFELLSPLLAGGTALLVPREVVADPEAVLEAAGEATVLHAVPSLMREVVRVARERGAPARLRMLLVGGDAVPPGLLAEMRAVFPGARTWVLYGPTEAAVVCTAYAVPVEGEVVGNPIGVPLGNASLSVRDPRGRPAPTGVPGELWIGGAAVAAGYLGRPELTAEKFVAGPEGTRWYRTGDRARWRGDGVLEFLGRTDRQVKVRGFRIEPGEVEGVLRGHPAVREAVVGVREDGTGERLLAAWFVAEGAPPEAAALREWLRERLPEHLVPTALLAVERIPLTAHGKTDHAALPAPDGAASGHEFVAPRTPAEEALAEVWREVLGVERVGARDDFFTLGGHSLLATRVAARLRERLGVELPLRAVFEASTLEALAARVDAAPGRGGEAETPPVVPLPRDGSPLPVSFAQQRLWLVHQLEPESPAYNMAAALRLHGRLDAGALRRSLDALVRRHESLRTVFAVRGGEPVQVVREPAGAALRVADLRGLPRAEREASAAALALRESLRPFDLAEGPLFRTTLLRLDEDEWGLLLGLHHVVSDGWSMGVLIGELSELYGALTEGRAPELAELPVQYADYAVWQRARLAGETLERQLAWWADRLRGAPPLLELPTDRPRAPLQDPRGASRAFRVPAETARALRELARREGATPFMALLAAWQAVLARWSGQDDVSVGTPVAGRTRVELEGLIGFFVNTLVLRADLSGRPGFRALLTRVRETALGAFAHQEVPFERLVEALAPERSLTHAPLFQAMFALQELDGGELRLGALEVEPLAPAGEVAKFDLELQVAEDGDGLAGTLVFRTALFDAATAERMAAHFGVLLAGVVADPDACVRDLPLTSGAELRALESWGAARPDLPAEGTVLGRFEAQAARTPEAAALRSGSRSLTYAGLDARAERLAAELRLRGVAPGDRVGVALERSPELVAAMLATWKAGAVYLPLDPAYPRERLEFLLADAAPKVVVRGDGTSLDGSGVELVSPGQVPSPPGPLSPASGRKGEQHREKAGVVAAGGTPLPRPLPRKGGGEHDGARIGSGDAPPPERGRVASLGEPGGGPQGADLAYLIYTSGSTGTPKAVAVTHGSLAATLAATADVLGFGAGDVVAALASPAFDISLFELLSPLLAGGTALLVPRELVADPEAVLEAAGEATVLHAVPSLMREVVRVARERRAPARLRTLLVGGDTVPPGLLAEMRAVFPGARTWVLYGPTEAAVVCTAYAVPAEGPVVGNPIGVPLGNASLSVREPGGAPAPAGVPGELWIGGAAVAAGYLGRPDLTAERFVAGPEGTRWYRTGDRARWRGDGVLEFLGRTDRQVKVRGFRIEPGEVEGVLRGHPAVREAVVGVREDAAGERLLAAWFVAEGAPPAAAELRRWLRERLPEHLVPTALAALERIPLTAHGKTDHAALPAPDGAASGHEFVAPRTPTEAVLAEAWGEVLGVERVGVRDDFFTLGGHSLRATQVVSRVRDRLGVELPLRAVFEAPTVEGLARRVEEARGGAPAAGVPLTAAAAGGDEELAVFPLSFAQQRLWFLDQMDPGNPAYNIAGAYHLRGELDVAALERALDELRRRHESLRTVFAAAAEGPVQVVRPWRPEALPLRDLSGGSRPAVEAEVDRRVAEVAATPFDLARGPLLRTELLRLADGEHVLVRGVHHVVADGWSMGVFDRELRALYEAFAAGEPSPLPELEVRYADFAVWQRETLAGDALEAQLAFWRERLRGAPTLELPTDRPRPPVQTFGGAAHGRVLPAELAARLRAVGQAERATPFMVLLAAWQLLLSRWAGQEDVTVGTPVANRNRREVEGLIGFFVNTLAVRVDLAGRPGFREAVRRVRDGALAAFAHQDLPFEKVVEELRPERDPSRTPVFQVVFSMQDASGGAAHAGGLEWGAWSGEGHTAKFDLALGMADGPDGLHALLEYNTDLFEPATVERMAAQLGVLLEAVAADPDRPVADVPLLVPGERERLAEWSVSGAPSAPAGLLHERFAEQAARAPERTALVRGGERVTYAELDRRADALAGRLRALGVGPGSRVAVRLERSPAMVAGLLAVLKAGGAYVALDPADAEERLAAMLAESGAGVLVEGDGGAEYDLRSTGPAAPGPSAVRRAPTPDDLACVVFVPGPGGEPVGVEVPHRAVAGTAAGSDGGETLLQHSPVSGEGLLLELWPALLAGGACVLHRGRGPDAEALSQVVREHGVTALSLAPPYFARVVDTRPDALAGLRRLLVTGPVPAPHARRALEANPGLRLDGGWGAAECGGLALREEVARELGGRVVSLGRPVGDRRVHVLDVGMEPVPAGVPGELCVGGPGVARGYAGRAVPTAERFVPDPFSAEPGARLFRTGELARWGADGVLERMGRTGAPVRVRGFRVEPGEVEAVLVGLPGVRDAAVVVREDVPGDARLVGYVVPEAGPSPDPAALRSLLLERVPEPVVPGAVVVLAELPLAADGGVDAGALPAPAAAGDADAHVAPRTPVEERIAAIWREVLRVERVGVHDRFFDLGGHSLRATQVVTRIREAFRADLPVRALFETPTVAALAARLEAQAGAAGAAAADDGPITRQSREGRGRRAPRRPEA